MKFGLLILLPVAVLAQHSMSYGELGTLKFTKQSTMVAPPVGSAYSADEVMESFESSNGKPDVLSPPRIRKLYRDAEGRSRTETPLVVMGARENRPGPPPATLIQVVDPIAGFQYTLDEANRVAHRSKLNLLKRGGTRSPVANGFVRVISGENSRDLPIGTGTTFSVNTTSPRLPTAEEKMVEEDLGTQVIGDRKAEGYRLTTHVAGGFVTDESWTDPRSRLILLRKSTAPSHGVVVRLINIDFAEPAPVLFQVPPGYAIVDEAGEFEIHYRAE
jgi:hypothetical protein